MNKKTTLGNKNANRMIAFVVFLVLVWYLKCTLIYFFSFHISDNATVFGTSLALAPFNGLIAKPARQKSCYKSIQAYLCIDLEKIFHPRPLINIFFHFFKPPAL